MAGFSAGQGGVTGGASGPAQSGVTSSLSFGGNAGIGRNGTLNPVTILFGVAGMLILLLLVFRITK